MREQEQLYFPSELFITSVPETKIMVLEVERHHSISDPNTMFTSKKESILLRYLPQSRSGLIYKGLSCLRKSISYLTWKYIVINGINIDMKFVLREGIYLHQTRICRADEVLTSSVKRQTPQRDYYLILERIKKIAANSSPGNSQRHCTSFVYCQMFTLHSDIQASTQRLAPMPLFRFWRMPQINNPSSLIETLL